MFLFRTRASVALPLGGFYFPVTAITEKHHGIMMLQDPLSQYNLEFTSNGSDVEGLLADLQQVSYFNRYKHPVFGTRQIHVETRIRYKSHVTSEIAID